MPRTDRLLFTSSFIETPCVYCLPSEDQQGYGMRMIPVFVHTSCPNALRIVFRRAASFSHSCRELRDRALVKNNEACLLS